MRLPRVQRAAWSLSLPRYLRTRAGSSLTLAESSVLVGPPDPVSNIRPVLRGTVLKDGTQAAHPYSLSEFSRSEVVGYSASALHERHLETLNHSFWTDVNTRFNAARQEILDSHPPAKSPEEAAARDAALEANLAAFYRTWLSAEDARFRAYTMQYYVEQARGIWLAFRSYWLR
ncbi:hypothetical protein FS749_003385 [Ceratobasidium sp. UAMH 11750]|nr:hypothetical protein FS749_003385 [Ceratobasidium sp. UAMH 11750]